MIALWLPYPFDLPFMQRALAAGLVVGVFAPMIGTFLVQKRLSLIGDGIGHVAFAGVGAGLLLGVNPVLSALVFAVVGALGVDRLRARRKASGDVALALFFYSGIALGVVFASLGGGLNASILTYLFGQPLTVTRSEIAAIFALGAAIAIVMWTLRRVLFAVVTDEDWSRVAGLPVDAMNAVLAVLTAVAVVAAMRIVGILLIAALMVLPVATAQLLSRSFRSTLLLSVAVGVASVVVGLTASFVFDIAASGAMVLATAAVFAVVSIGKRAAPRTLRQEEHA
ncbi:MAG TPA: metal ABC transporter permease [Actinomycetota bacterium]|nr:metal ABC transporter permease [Actinomycetota bacterium]